MTTWWYCLACVAGGLENAASTMAEGHTKRTQHPTATTVNCQSWLTKMQTTAATRGEVE